MADAKTERQKVKEITEKLEQGIKELFESEKYKSYLNTMSKFHNYSFNNTVLIAMQKPDATLVAGFNSWKKNFKRHVKKGEKGIKILAPTPYKIKQEQEKTDPKTKEILLDKDGNPIMEEVEITIPAFRAVSVFDVAQTEGKELPELEVKELSDSVEDYENFMQALQKISPVPMDFEEIEGDAKGYFSFATHRIAIQEGMSQSQTLKTAIHEVAHAKLHDRNLNLDAEAEKDRNTEEVEAESVAYTVCQHFGIETSDYSFAYIAGWSAGKELPELKASLDTIRRTASEIITGVERELQKERERTVVKEPVDQDRSLETIASTDVVLLVQAENASEILRITNFSVDDVKRRLRDFALSHPEKNVKEYLMKKGADVISIASGRESVETYLPFFDLQYEPETFEITDIAELSMIKQAEYLIHRLEFRHSAFSPEEKNILTNYAFKLGDMEKTKEYAYALASSGANGVERVGETIRNMQAEIDALPDAMVGISEMLEYGYTWQEMLPLTAEKARELFEHDLTIYSLYEDGAETMIEDRKEILEHKGMFGIEKGDWEQYLQLRSLTTVQEESMDEREHRLLYGRDNQFGIYQLNDSPQARDIHFMNSDFLEMKGITVARENYDLVYTAPLEEGTNLEDIFTRFNIERPEDFRGHSLSVSDVVVLHQNGENTCHFVDSFGYKEVPEFLQEMIPEKQAEKTSVIKETSVEEADPVSYYVIEDISTWAENKPEKSKLERFDSFREALEQFKVYREKYTQTDDKTRTTLGFNVQGSEFDALYARNNENILSLDFIHSSKALQSNRFMDDLQILCNELVDKVRVYREMTPEEVKTFVKERFQYKLESSGLDDIDMYMSRFDTLYEQGKMEHLMPSVNQKRIVEDIPLEKWDNPYFALNEAEQMAFAVKDKYVSIQVCDEGFDYSIYHADYSLFDGGVYDNPDISIHAALYDILEDIGAKRRELIPVDYDELAEKAEAMEQAKIAEQQAAMEKEAFAEQMPEEQKTIVTLTVAECGEFHNLGEYHEGIASVDEALAVFKSIPQERLHGVPSIGITVHTEGSVVDAGVQMDVISGKIADLEVLEYVPDISTNPKAIEMIAELIDKMPDIEVRGYLEKWQAAILATQIDQFSYEYDTYQYQDTVEDREAQVANIMEDIRNGNIGYLKDFLNAVIAEEVRDGITDIFGQGVEPEDSEAVQTARKAQELLEKLSAFEPLAKAEELEEKNDNLVDDISTTETKRVPERISIKEKLAEKRAIVVQKDKGGKSMPEKDSEKKKQREM